MYKEKIEKLVRLLNGAGEQDMAKDMDEILKSCAFYIDRVVAMESAQSILRFTLEPDDYRMTLTELDKNRKIAHNGLIANVKLMNRYCKLVGIDPIFKGDTDSRIEVAEFAMEIVKDIFETRKL